MRHLTIAAALIIGAGMTGGAAAAPSFDASLLSAANRALLAGWHALFGGPRYYHGAGYWNGAAWRHERWHHGEQGARWHHGARRWHHERRR